MAITLRSDLDRKLTIEEMDNNFIFLSASYTYREVLDGSTTSYSINHGLSEEFPIVQLYESGSKAQVIPSEITSVDANNLTVTFAENFNGNVIVKK